MEWKELYNSSNQPNENDIKNFISNPLWEDLNTFIKENYEVEPKLNYSRCSAQPGWNIK